MVLIVSCKHKPNPVAKPDTDTKTEGSVSKSEKSSVHPGSSITDDQASFIAGMSFGKNDCLSKLDSTIKWRKYAGELDSMFAHANYIRIKKMKIWADSELIKNNRITTIFYPFSGPDFLNADIFYPDADQYIMIGMEPIGSLPDLCKMTSASVYDYLNTVSNSLKDIFKRSYFITSRMSADLRNNKVNGTIPLLSLFIKRTGHQIISVRRIGVDSAGKWQYTDSLKDKKNLVQGIKVDFHSLSSDKVQSVYYFRTDISDKGLSLSNGFRIYLSELPQSYTYLKAASYLMHSNDFKIIRSLIFDVSSTILQDDSGIAYKYFDKGKWDIRLYGKYSKPKDEFSYINEPDLQKAYKSSIIRPLPYSLGYNWGTDHSNMLYAIKTK